MAAKNVPTIKKFYRHYKIVVLKMNATIKLGYNYEFWIYDNKGEKINCYD